MQAMFIKKKYNYLLYKPNWELRLILAINLKVMYSAMTSSMLIQTQINVNKHSCTFF